MTETEGRRTFLTSVLMWGGLALGYGIGAYHFIRYLVPMGAGVKYREMFAGPVDGLSVGQSKTIRTPRGESFVMARTPDGFRVLSDVCPHLGCRVHWDPQAKQFICPCHMGIFDAEGKAVAGPPFDAGQRLEQLETTVRGNSVFVLIKES